MRLVIVDDSDVLRARLVEILSEIVGVEIIAETKNSDEAVKAVECLVPDVVILDIRIPGKNGMSVLETIKKRKNPPIVVMFTNYPYLQYRKKSMDLGADFFFYKAIEFEKLVILIKDLVKTKKFGLLNRTNK